MTTQQLLPLTPAGAVLIGDAAALVTGSSHLTGQLGGGD
jgi:hypothetical protein